MKLASACKRYLYYIHGKVSHPAEKREPWIRRRMVDVANNQDKEKSANEEAVFHVYYFYFLRYFDFWR